MCATDLFSTFGSGMSDFMDAGQPHAVLAAVAAAALSPCVHLSAHAQRLPLCCFSCRLSALFVRTSLSMLKAAYHLLDNNACGMVLPMAHGASARAPAHPVLQTKLPAGAPQASHCICGSAATCPTCSTPVHQLVQARCSPLPTLCSCNAARERGPLFCHFGCSA